MHIYISFHKGDTLCDVCVGVLNPAARTPIHSIPQTKSATQSKSLKHKRNPWWNCAEPFGLTVASAPHTFARLYGPLLKTHFHNIFNKYYWVFLTNFRNPIITWPWVVESNAGKWAAGRLFTVLCVCVCLFVLWSTTRLSYHFLAGCWHMRMRYLATIKWVSRWAFVGEYAFRTGETLHRNYADFILYSGGIWCIFMMYPFIADITMSWCSTAWASICYFNLVY